jgi:hypothetical protein
MKKQIITLGLAVFVAGSSAYGFGMRDGQGCGDDFPKDYKRVMLLNSHKSSNGMYSLMSTISDLDFTRVQRVEIRKVMFDLKEKNIETMEDKKTLTLPFTKDGKFNKEDFINNRAQFSKQMIKVQASMIEKILNILDEEQKKIVIQKLSLQKNN